jgi:hypothetical protein
MNTQSSKLDSPSQFITGRRIKNKSLKITLEDTCYVVIYTVYFFGYVWSRKKHVFPTLSEAEQCYEQFAFRKFKGRI